MACIGLLLSCASPQKTPPLETPTATTAPATSSPPSNVPHVVNQSKSRWIQSNWSDLPGIENDNLNEAWVAWLQSCSRSAVAASPLCQSIKRLNGQSVALQRAWLVQNFQPYRVESLQNTPQPANGQLTAYYEPVLEASKVAKPGFTIPLYSPPANLKSRSPWYTREEIGKLPAAQTALKGKELAFLADPVDAMILHIQGSGRLWVTQADGSRQQVRLAFAGTNDQPYQSIGRWLLDQNLTKDASWPGIKAWLAQNARIAGQESALCFFQRRSADHSKCFVGPQGCTRCSLDGWPLYRG
jgi:membrane-bound lytic murein transglycosylase A